MPSDFYFFSMNSWYYLANNVQHGPVDEVILKDALSSGQLPVDTLVWMEGMEGWVSINLLPAFSASSALGTTPVLTKPTISSAAQTPQGFPIRLEQKNFLRGKQTFEILNERLLRFEIGKGKTKKEGQMPLATIDPKPIRIRKWEAGSLVIAILVGFLGLAVIAGGIASLIFEGTLENLGPILFCDFFFGIFAAMLIGNAYIKRRNSIVYASSSRTPIALWFENPDKKTFDNFLAQLQLAIDRADRHTVPDVQQTKEAAKPIVCAKCQSPEVVHGHATFLCEPCRVSLIERPIPVWIKIAAGAMALLMLISAVRIPWELSASLNYERGKIAEDKGDYPTAIQDFQKALASYPRSVDLLTSLARAAHRAGDQPLALDAVNRLIARLGPDSEVSKDTIDLINQIRGNKP